MKILLREKDRIENGVAFSMHSHPFWQLDFVDCESTDAVWITVEDDQRAISRNEVALIPPYVNHKTLFKERVNGFTLKFELISEDRIIPGAAFIPVRGGFNGELMKYLMDDSIWNHPNGERMVEHYLWIFLLHNFPGPSEENGEEVRSEQQKRLARVLNYLERNVTGKSSLDELAQMANMSVGHFIRSFREETGMTPHAYVRYLKIERAKKLLLYSEMNVSMIADSLKFPDVYSFSRAFKSICGCAPSHYHKK